MSAGICLIKDEFIVRNEPVVQDAQEILSATGDNENNENLEKLDLDNNEEESPCKKVKWSKQEKKKHKQRGQNKSRPAPYKVADDDKLCRVLTDVLVNETKTCPYPNCKYQHDVLSYLKNKPKDIGETCYVYRVQGRCPMGVACRYGTEHTTPEGHNLTAEDYDPSRPQTTLNQLDVGLQAQLRKKSYDFTRAKQALRLAERTRSKPCQATGKTDDNEGVDEVKKTENGEASSATVETAPRSGCVTDEDIVALRKSERKTIDWKDKLFLSPLTTVGNLPFRRICKEFGADVTCGEMAVSLPLLSGHGQEWALVKRHHTEDIFGVQLCGQSADLVSKAGQLLRDHCSVDYVDINVGCPIELIYQRGGGAALLRRPNILELVVRSCANVLDVPVTVKARTGVYADKSVAHELIPRFKDWGVACATIHGRSREQRYTRTADWRYIERCAEAASRRGLPVIGNGDILSYQDYLDAKTVAPHVSGVMLGRGALIKPWLFEEIKRGGGAARDVSSSERFEMLRRYTNYGLEHWGSDTKGVENTRRFLLEWQSFLYRYVPVGLLERPPQRINERPPQYRGRDDMETLMASNNCRDWIAISEMLLGPVPDGFTFLPKHKANSYA